MKDFLKKNSDIIFTCIFVIIVALLGSIFVSLGKDWFASLLKPSQWLPDFVISILWTVIYILFAVIVSILFKKGLIKKNYSFIDFKRNTERFMVSCVLHFKFTFLR